MAPTSRRLTVHPRRVPLLLIVVALITGLGALIIRPHGATHGSGSSATPAPPQIVGYYGEWDKGCGGCVPLSKASLNDLTALDYAFASPRGDGCRLGEPGADAKTDFPVIRAAKRADPDLQVLLSLGGGDSKHFAQAVSTPSRINALVSHCQALMTTFSGVFDGVDIDWEHPSNRAQEKHFTQLVEAFRSALGAQAPITAAVTPYFSINWKVVTPLLSWVNLMTYDLHGPWDSTTDFLAPVRADPSDPHYSPANSASSDAKTMINTFGIPAAKILLGVPFYGYGYSHTAPANNGLFQPFSGTYGSPDAGGSWDYWQIVNVLEGKRHFTLYGPDARSKENWLYRPGQRTGVFLSFDGRSTMRAKANIVRSLGLGGVMIWDISYDTRSSRTSLLAALHKYLS
jgi:chitinase